MFNKLMCIVVIFVLLVYSLLLGDCGIDNTFKFRASLVALLTLGVIAFNYYAYINFPKVKKQLLKNKDIDIQPTINKMTEDLQKIIEPEGWIREDDRYFEYKPRSKPNKKGQLIRPNSAVVFIPDILYYNNEAHIWFRIDEVGEVSQEAKNILFSKIKPFKDEDYSGTRSWINPYYLKGFFHNHTLS